MAPIAAINPRPDEIRVVERASPPGHWEKARLVWDGHLLACTRRIGCYAWAFSIRWRRDRCSKRQPARWRSITGRLDRLILNRKRRPHGAAFRSARPIVDKP